MFGTSTYHQTLRKMVIAFGSLFNDINIKRTNTSGVVIETLKIPVAYGPKQKFMVRIANPSFKGPAIVLPRIGFMMSQIMYDGTRKLKTTGKNYSSISGTGRTQYNPVPYNFIFDLAILAKNAEDAAQIVEQILPNFTPEFTVTIKTVPEMDVKVDCPIILNSVNYIDSYDGDFETRRAISWDMQFTMKGFVYPELSTTGKLIKDIRVDINVPSNSIEQTIGNFDKIILEDSTDFTINSLLQQNGTDALYLESSDEGLLDLSNTESVGIKPNPLDSEPDDDFGFSVSIDGTETGWT
tara:strand:+ start:2710 stop:3597 length:888 start_codon:yes stop_codon:yes gene_type:complete